ncbi:sensor histidine kinase [Hymenobacter cellulosilyticus]|uniref:histidine kinase n=1 Tax=Hymenobacter cellulosilyticus TaxID=2932248 RepID=A0A8T9Q4I6_9BACT|nr:7TM diverse intracellular signaling domain-containing protein [Hymenobacter cellulosilyticus]UOQ72417.1 histidine kinase [Hymenobacter cellulosilyticus]
MLIRLLSFCVLLLGFLVPGRAQSSADDHTVLDTLYLQDENHRHVSEVYRYCTEPFAVKPSPERADSLWQAGAFQTGRWHKALSLGFLHQRVWVRIAVANTSSQRSRYVWSIYNFTDSATLYFRPNGSEQFHRVQASSWQQADQRPFPARSLSFPFVLEAGQRAVLYLRVDHRAGALYLPTYIETTEQFLASEVEAPFERHWIWLLGFYVSSALFNLVLYTFLRDRIHIWYVVYVVCITLFLLMEDGFDAWVLPAALYRLVWSVGQFNFLLLAAACGVQIMQSFLRLRSGWPRLYRLGNWLSALAAAFVLAYAVLFPVAVRSGLLYPTLLNGLREVLLGALALYSWVTLLNVLLSRRRRQLGAYYALTYFFFFVGFLLFWLNHLGLTNFNLVQPNALAWGLVLELLVLSGLLTGRFRHTLRQNEKLRIRQLRQRNAQSARLIAAQEEERAQLARELHDALGPNLAALHMAWQGPAMREALATSPAAAAVGQHTELLLRHLRDEVRTYSHTLLPSEPGLGTLSESLAALSKLHNLHGSPVVRTYCDAAVNELPTHIQQTAYRIAAELLNNAIRHSRANEVSVQMLRHSEELEIMVEDNGRGFAEPSRNSGIGLRGCGPGPTICAGSSTSTAPRRAVVLLSEFLAN